MGQPLFALDGFAQCNMLPSVTDAGPHESMLIRLFGFSDSVRTLLSYEAAAGDRDDPAPPCCLCSHTLFDTHRDDVSIVVVLKALGAEADAEIMSLVCGEVRALAPTLLDYDMCLI